MTTGAGVRDSLSDSLADIVASRVASRHWRVIAVAETSHLDFNRSLREHFNIDSDSLVVIAVIDANKERE